MPEITPAGGHKRAEQCQQRLISRGEVMCREYEAYQGPLVAEKPSESNFIMGTTKILVNFGNRAHLFHSTEYQSSSGMSNPVLL